MSDFKKKILYPLVIPLVSILVIVALSVSFSRLFLSSHKEGTNIPVIIASSLTVVFMLIFFALSLAKKMRASSLFLAFSVICIVITVIGGISYGSGESDEAELLPGQVLEAEQVDTNQLEIDALPTNSFQAKEFDIKSGVIKVDYIGKGGSHNLNIKDSRYGWFKPTVNGEQTATEYINLDSGSYYIYCSIPGHEQAGMFADLVVS